jgi:signal transduction histidine kinase
MSVAILLALFWVDSTGLIPVNQFTYMSLFGIVLFTFPNIGMMAWRVRSFNSQLEMQVVARTRELVQEREQVEAKVRDAVREIREKDDLPGFQSRQAATGEMLDFIAHQWKQSLYAISVHSELLRSRIRQAWNGHRPHPHGSSDGYQSRRRHIRGAGGRGRRRRYSSGDFPYTV